MTTTSPRTVLACALAALLGAAPATAARAPALDRLPVSGLDVSCAGASGPVQWLVDGRRAATGPAFRPDERAVGHRLACRSVRGTSGGRVVAGRPTVGGVPLVGSVVSCNAGRAMPAAAVAPGIAVAWYRGRRLILRTSGRRYRLRALDAGRNVSCRVGSGPAAGARTRGTQIWGPPRVVGSLLAGHDARCRPTWPRGADIGYRWSIRGPDGSWARLPAVFGETYPVSPAEPGAELRCAIEARTFAGRRVRAVSTAVTLVTGWRAPGAGGAWSARVFADRTVARARPSRSAPAVGTLSGQSELLGGVKWVAVTDVRRRGATLWAKVLLSSRPNGLQGWVPDVHLDFRFNPTRVLVDQSARTLTITRHGRRLAVMRAGVGKRATPTPNGLFAIESHIPTPNEGAYGPMVLVLTGHSPVLYAFDGGDGRLAIHGTNRRSSVGRAESFGCVRLGNRDVLRASRLIPDGTLVEIRP